VSNSSLDLHCSIQKSHPFSIVKHPFTSRDDYAAALELIQAGKIRVREIITHRVGLAETGHFYLSLRGAAGDVAISLALNSDSWLLTTDY
jgi:threonine dehydrogenase-like Zn-dependent dehydrogenase